MNLEKLKQSIRKGGLEKQKAITTIYDMCWGKISKKKVKELTHDKWYDFFMSAFEKIIFTDRVFNIKTNICGFLSAATINNWFNSIKEKKKFDELYQKYKKIYGNSIELKDIENNIDESLFKEKEKLKKELLAKFTIRECKQIYIMFSGYSTEEQQKLLGFKNKGVLKTRKQKIKSKVKKVLEENPELRTAIDVFFEKNLI